MRFVWRYPCCTRIRVLSRSASYNHFHAAPVSSVRPLHSTTSGHSRSEVESHYIHGACTNNEAEVGPGARTYIQAPPLPRQRVIISMGAMAQHGYLLVSWAALIKDTISLYTSSLGRPLSLAVLLTQPVTPSPHACSGITTHPSTLERDGVQCTISSLSSLTSAVRSMRTPIIRPMGMGCSVYKTHDVPCLLPFVCYPGRRYWIKGRKRCTSRPGGTQCRS